VYIQSLWLEYEEGETKEALLVKCLDKLDAVLHFINHSDLSKDNVTGDPMHFGIYGNCYFEKCPEIKKLLNRTKKELKKKYLLWGIPWEKEFEIKWN
jgi:5'-deoxynucleotidase YfbR-like HD superfamily hydrolase